MTTEGYTAAPYQAKDFDDNKEIAGFRQILAQVPWSRGTAAYVLKAANL